MKKTIHDITFIANYLAIIIVLEVVMWNLPNIQLTVLLFTMFFTQRRLSEGIALIIGYTLVKGLIWGFSLYILPPLFAYIIYMFMVHWVVNEWKLAILGVLFAPIYGLSFAIMTYIVFEIDLWAYLLLDFQFQFIMGVNNFVTILLIYTRGIKILSQRTF